MNKHTGRWNEWSARTIIEQCVLRGITHAVICPGSRSTSLAVAASSTPGLETTVHPDERGAAFYALGIVKSTRNPVAIITTSGTAVANLLPAAVEAKQSRAPLLFLTADRPPELRGCGANQAIDQVNLFGGYATRCSDILCSDAELPLEFFKQEVDAALTAATRPGGEGAAHLNLMFREPFLSDSTTADSKVKVVEHIEHSEAGPLSKKRVDSIADTIRQAERGLLVVGALNRQSDQDAAKQWAVKLGWPCVADITSGLRFSPDLAQRMEHIDLLLCHEKFKWMKPDVVLWMGGAFVSKRLLEWIGKDEGCNLIRIHHDDIRQDPLHRAKQYLTVSVTAAWESLSDQIQPSRRIASWTDCCTQANQSIANLVAQGDLLGGGSLKETDVAQTITTLDGAPYQLFIGNSLAIREVDQVGAANSFIQQTGTNRGASGIDGLIATAAGFAKGNPIPTIALLGDLSALHDISSLALARNLGVPVVILILNNNGGGIFQFLPVRDQVDEFNTLFVAPHEIQFKPLAQAFGLHYTKVETLSSLTRSIKQALLVPQTHIIEVQIDGQRTYEAHQQRIAEINRIPV